MREADGEGSTFEREHILLTSGDIGRIECVQRGTPQGAIRAREFSRDPGALQLAYLVNRRPTTIEWGHCDPSGALFNSRYFEFSDWSTALLFQAATGMSKSELMAKYGANMPLVDVRGRFVQVLRLADAIEIASTIREFRRSSFDVTHQFLKDEEVMAETQETRVWCAIDCESPPNLKPLPLPPELIQQFKVS